MFDKENYTVKVLQKLMKAVSAELRALFQLAVGNPKYAFFAFKLPFFFFLGFSPPLDLSVKVSSLSTLPVNCLTPSVKICLQLFATSFCVDVFCVKRWKVATFHNSTHHCLGGYLLLLWNSAVVTSRQKSGRNYQFENDL